jgi:hypothetical protein
MKRILTILLIVFAFQTSMKAQCPPSSAPNGDIRNAIALVEHNGYKFTGALVNNSNEDGEYYFITSAYPFKYPCNGGNSTTSFLSQIKFTWSNGNSTYGATLETTVGGIQETVLLKLSTAPPFLLIPYLGVRFSNGNPSRAIQYYNSTLSEYPYGPYTYTNIETQCDQFNVDSYNFNFGTDAYAVTHTYNDISSSDERTKGGILLDGNERILGLYVTKGSSSSCSENVAYYAYPDGGIQSKLGSSTIRAIKIAPCVDEEIVNDIISTSTTKKASIRVIGKSKIDNVPVTFSAGQEVILENGFESGNEFIAEIKPCVSQIIPLAKISDEENDFAAFGAQAEEKIIDKNKDVSAYPTVMIDNQITLESEGLNRVQYYLSDLQGKILAKDSYFTENEGNTKKINLPALSSGIYLLYISDGQFSRTIKLIKE